MIFSECTQTRDYIVISDAVNTNILAFTGKEGIYNIRAFIGNSVNGLIRIFEKFWGMK